MGVRGLTKFVKARSDILFDRIKLRDTYLIIDGNCAVAVLFSNVGSSNPVFGGDYDRFGAAIEDFINLLRSCNISPIFIFDGGYETKKLSTVSVRNQDKVSSVLNLTPASHNAHAFPLLIREVFREKLTELNITFVQSDFEADPEIAAVARKLNCPVLSNDSDFFIFAVQYIPFSSFSFFLSEEYDPCGSKLYYISCEVYNVDKFLSCLGIDRSLLPLLAVLLGNDYIKRSAFKHFHSQLRNCRGRNGRLTEVRLKSIAEWLSHESAASAIKKMLDCVGKKKRRYLQPLLELVIRGYTSIDSPLNKYLPVDQGVLSEEPEVLQALKEAAQSMSSVEEDNFNDESSAAEDSPSSESEDLNLGSPAKSATNSNSGAVPPALSHYINAVPEWFIDHARKGNVHSSVITLLSLKHFFSVPQVEDCSLPSAFEIGEPVLFVIAGILMGSQRFALFKRVGRVYTKQYVRGVTEIDSFGRLPSLKDIKSLSVKQRQDLILSTFEVPHSSLCHLDSFPVRWKLLLIAIIYWGNHLTKPAFQTSYVHSLIFMLIFVDVMTKKIGYFRNKRPFMNKYAKRLNAYKKHKSFSTIPCLGESSECSTVDEAISNATEEDFLLIFEKILPYFQVDEKLKTNPRLFSVKIVHFFAQLQTCLSLITILNSLLLFPFESPPISQIYNSTMLYNCSINLKKRSSFVKYMSMYLSESPSICKTYLTLVDKFQLLLPNLHIKDYESVRKEKKRTKRVKSKSVADEKADDSKQMFDEEEDFIDCENKFSVLLKST